MKAFLSSALLVAAGLSLVACQAAPRGGFGLQSIDEPVTFGNAAVVNATARDRETITGYRQGRSGSITVVSETLIDIQRAGRCLHLRSEVRWVESHFNRIVESWQDVYRLRFAARQGRTVNYEADLDAGQVTASMTRRGVTSPETTDRSLMFNILLEQLHLGGQTVRQDETILEYRLGDLVAGLAGEEAELSYVLRAVGRSEFEGRSVVVAEAEGYVWGEDRPMGIDATIYFDEATGAAIHANTQLRHLSGADANTRIRIVRNLSFAEDTPGADGKPRAGRPFNRGHCYSEI